MTETKSGSLVHTLNAIGASYIKARKKHAPMRGPHEGYAVLLEEVDELWDEVKRWQPAPGAIIEEGETHDSRQARWDAHNKTAADMRKEALHVAAMALAFLIEVAPEPTP